MMSECFFSCPLSVFGSIVFLFALVLAKIMESASIDPSIGVHQTHGEIRLKCNGSSLVCVHGPLFLVVILLTCGMCSLPVLSRR
jgi:hypothetical protein